MAKGGSGAKAPQIAPLKNAETAIDEAKNETSRNQRLRASIASTFNRPGMMGAKQGTNSTTSGMGKTLGG